MKNTWIVLCGALTLALLLSGCAEEKKVEASGPEFTTKSLSPSKVEARGDKISMTVENLNVNMVLNKGDRSIAETPSLRGSYRIVNTSKELLEVQGITVEYVDQAGDPIAFQSGEKIAKTSLMLSALKPGESSEGTLDVTFPRAAVKGLAKINVHVVYIPSPLKRETLVLPEKVG